MTTNIRILVKRGICIFKTLLYKLILKKCLYIVTRNVYTLSQEIIYSYSVILFCCVCFKLYLEIRSLQIAKATCLKLLTSARHQTSENRTIHTNQPQKQEKKKLSKQRK